MRSRRKADGGLSTLSSLGVALLAAGFVVVVLLGVDDAARRARQLDDRRSEAIASRADPATTAGPTAAAFRSFRSELGRRARFALVYDGDDDRNERGFYRLFSASYLYPAIAVADPARADAVMVFGEPPPRVRDRFDEIGVVDGVWLGRRKAE